MTMSLKQAISREYGREQDGVAYCKVLYFCGDLSTGCYNNLKSKCEYSDNNPSPETNSLPSMEFHMVLSLSRNVFVIHVPPTTMK